MKQRKRHSPTEIVEKLRSADRILGTGGNLQEVLQELQVSEPTYHRWRNQYGGMKAEERLRLKEAETRVLQLERTLAEQRQDVDILRATMRDLLKTPEERRAVVKELVERYGLSERRACECVGQNRSTQRYRSRFDDEDDCLVEGAVIGAGGTSRNGHHDSDGAPLPVRRPGSDRPWNGRSTDDPSRDSRVAARDRGDGRAPASHRSESDLSTSIRLPPPRSAEGRAWGDGHGSTIRSPASSEE